MKILSSVPKDHFEKNNVTIPEEWDVVFIDHKFRTEDVEANKDADVFFTSSDEAVSAEMMDAAPHLKMIHTEGASFDKIDTAAAKDRGIPVCSNIAVNKISVAEHVVALILASLRRIPQNDTLYKKIGFTEAKRVFHMRAENELAGKTVGIIGLGAIGKEVAKRLAGWSVDIVYYDLFRPSAETEAEYGVRYLDFDDLCRQADIITIHVPVLPSTRNMFDEKRLAMLRPNAILINTARGELVDNEALAKVLEEGRIYGAALDTISPEPIPMDHVLLNLSPEASDRLIITTHTAGMTNEAFYRMLTNFIANVRRIEAGEAPVNIVYR